MLKGRILFGQTSYMYSRKISGSQPFQCVASPFYLKFFFTFFTFRIMVTQQTYIKKIELRYV